MIRLCDRKALISGNEDKLQNMKEEFLYHLWQNAIFDKANLQTTAGEKLEIFTFGVRNTNAGPDFFNAKVMIGDTLWAGNVEIHVKSSDWELHGHQHDEAYNSVVLHVVTRDDKPVHRKSGNAIPTLILPISDSIYQNYCSLNKQTSWIKCEHKLHTINELTRVFWLEKMLVERLEQRSMDVERILESTNDSWEEALYVLLARGFGFGVNADAFEQLARSLPLKILAKHKNDLLQLEALLFGQSGMLDVLIQEDEYTMLLQREYKVLKSKYSLQSIDAAQWKYLRLRPANFPSVRIAQFAQLIHQSSSLFSKIKEAASVQTIFELLSCKTSEYWFRHYMLAKLGDEHAKTLGCESKQLLVINVIVPVLFVWARRHDDNQLHDRILQMLEAVDGERNSVIDHWADLGFETQNAAQTQALLFGYQHYCQNDACLQCAIGRKLIHS